MTTENSEVEVLGYGDVGIGSEYKLKDIINDSIDEARERLKNNEGGSALIYLEKAMDFIKCGLHLRSLINK